MLDVWTYLDHGHVFATAQSGNVVLFAIDAASGHAAAAWTRVPSLAAFVSGLLLSRLGGTLLKRRGVNSRTVRLLIEGALLLALLPFTDRLPDDVVTACVGFVAALQITSLSHIGPWSFNTGMTTGNLRSGFSALAEALVDPGSEKAWRHAAVLGCLCVAFAAGALMGGFLVPRWHELTLCVVSGLVLCGALVSYPLPDPIAYPA